MNSDLESNSPSLYVKLVFIVFAALCGVAVIGAAYVTSTIPRDLEVFLSAAKTLAVGHSLYDPAYMHINTISALQLPYYYPPLLAVLFKPFAQYELKSVSVLWSVCSYLFLFFAALGISLCLQFTRLAKIHYQKRFIVCFLCLLPFGPVWIGFREGQVHTLILLLLSFYVYLTVSKRYALAAILLAVATWIKLTPALLLLAPLRFKQYKVVVYFCVSSVVLFVLLWISGISLETYIRYLSTIPDLITNSFFFDKADNFSPLIALARVAGLEAHSGYLQLLRYVFLLLPLIAICLVKRCDSEGQLYTHAMLICAMIFVSPIVWAHHFTWLTLPLVVIFASRASNKRGRYIRTALCVIIYLIFLRSGLELTLLTEEKGALGVVTQLLPFAVVLVMFGCLLLNSRDDSLC